MEQAARYLEPTTQPVFSRVSRMEDRFSTEPILVVKPEEQVCEEELHNGFEQAISARLQRISSPLIHWSLPTSSGRCTDPVEVVLLSVSQQRQYTAKAWVFRLGRISQRGIILVCLALLLIMSGFDLMGLLVLHQR